MKSENMIILKVETLQSFETNYFSRNIYCDKTAQLLYIYYGL